MQIQYIPIKEQIYKAQYEAMKRWYWRLQPYLGTGKQTVFSKIDTYPSDFFEAFFITCYHIRDYLIDSGIRKEEIDNFINGSVPLKICADLCNLTKHVRFVKRKPRMSPDIKLDTPVFMYRNESGEETVSSMLMIQDGDKLYDPLKLAENCIKEWNKFLKNKSLPIPELIEEKMFLCFDESNSNRDASI
jgi:hypothetical protein